MHAHVCVWKVSMTPSKPTLPSNQALKVSMTPSKPTLPSNQGFQAFLAENLLCALEPLTLLSFRH